MLLIKGAEEGARMTRGSAVRRPEAREMNVYELIDNRFVKELDDSGFVKALYGGK
jgi:hypothetical protein